MMVHNDSQIHPFSYVLPGVKATKQIGNEGPVQATKYNQICVCVCVWGAGS